MSFETANAGRVNLYAITLSGMPAEENLRDSVDLGAFNDAEEMTDEQVSSPFGGLSLLLCALGFYYIAVLRVDYTKMVLLDLAA